MIPNLNEHDLQIMGNGGSQHRMTEPRTDRGKAVKLLMLMVIGTTTMLEVAHSAVAPHHRPNIVFFINDDQVKE